MPDGAVSHLASQNDGDMALDMLLSRRSMSPALLGDPAPGEEDLNDILDAALRAPDHGRLRPWRFVIVRGTAREKLGALFADALWAREPDASAKALENERQRAFRGPLIICVGASLNPEHAVPEVEQVLSVGAAVMNMLNAVHALGYGAMWVTGKRCYDAGVNEALGFGPPDRLVGFLHVGTPTEPVRPTERPVRADHVSEWTGPLNGPSSV